MERQQFDQAYIQRLVGGDAATESHFASYFGNLLRIKLRSRLRSPHLVDDAIQEVFLRTFRTLKQKGGLQTPAALGGYVNSVCNNVLFEFYRAESRFAEIPSEIETLEEDPELRLVTAECKAQVHAILAELPPKDRDLLRTFFLEERDRDEICREFQVERPYLRVLMHRAKLRFKEGFARQRAAAS